MDHSIAAGAAGIIYAVNNDGRFPCGVPGVLNSEFEQFMGGTMSTIRYRTARVAELFTFRTQITKRPADARSARALPGAWLRW